MTYCECNIHREIIGCESAKRGISNSMFIISNDARWRMLDMKEYSALSSFSNMYFCEEYEASVSISAVEVLWSQSVIIAERWRIVEKSLSYSWEWLFTSHESTSSRKVDLAVGLVLLDENWKVCKSASSMVLWALLNCTGWWRGNLYLLSLLMTCLFHYQPFYPKICVKSISYNFAKNEKGGNFLSVNLW